MPFPTKVFIDVIFISIPSPELVDDPRIMFETLATKSNIILQSLLVLICQLQIRS